MAARHKLPAGCPSRSREYALSIASESLAPTTNLGLVRTPPALRIQMPDPRSPARRARTSPPCPNFVNCAAYHTKSAAPGRHFSAFAFTAGRSPSTVRTYSLLLMSRSLPQQVLPCRRQAYHSRCKGQSASEKPATNKSGNTPTSHLAVGYAKIQHLKHPTRTFVDAPHNSLT